MKSLVLGAVIAAIVPLVPSTYVYGLDDEVPERMPVEVITASVSGYTASPDETDDTPDIVASGKKVAIGMVACPSRYAFGTEIEINGRKLVCEDRMNLRYRDKNNFDIFFASKSEAYAFGRQELQVKIYE